jgi:transposase
MQRHRHQEFIRFLNAIEREVSAGKLIHVILDNYAAYKHPKVIEWLARHPRFTFHFTPTSAAWLNAVQGFFAKLAKQRLKRGVFHSLVSLPAAINQYVAQANGDPRPFRWTKDRTKSSLPSDGGTKRWIRSTFMFATSSCRHRKSWPV